MDSNQDKIIETRLGKALRKAFKQLLEEIDGELALFIESDDDEANVSEETIAHIRA